MSEPIFVATGNAGKLREFGEILGVKVEGVALDLIEPQSLDVRDVARAKAQQAFEILAHPVLVDDTALSINAWNGLPGALVSWFLDAVGVDGVLRMAREADDRGAQVTTAIAYADAAGVQVFEGTLQGTIPDEPRGDGGFGYDAIFIPQGSSKTFAEMDAQEKNQMSMRKLALERVRAELFRH